MRLLGGQARQLEVGLFCVDGRSSTWGRDGPESSGYRKCAGMAKHLRAAEVENCECRAWADARSDTVRDILA